MSAPLTDPQLRVVETVEENPGIRFTDLVNLLYPGPMPFMWAADVIDRTKAKGYIHYVERPHSGIDLVYPGRKCRGCSAIVAGSDSDVCETCDLHS